MDPLQEQFERGVGDRFAQWLSTTTGEPCTFLRRADRAPDLVYSFNAGRAGSGLAMKHIAYMGIAVKGFLSHSLQ